MLGAIAGRFLFRSSTVQNVDMLGQFVRFDAAGASLRGAPWRPGDKVQVFLPGIGMRTSTPLQWGIFTGRAASTQAVKRGLSGFSFASKTYWADGKAGLD